MMLFVKKALCYGEMLKENTTAIFFRKKKQLALYKQTACTI